MDKEEYYESINTQDVGSVYQLRRVVNEKLIKKGYKKLKKYAKRKQLCAIYKRT